MEAYGIEVNLVDGFRRWSGSRWRQDSYAMVSKPIQVLWPELRSNATKEHGSRKAAPSRAQSSLSPAPGCQPESTLELAGHVALIGEPCSERCLHQGHTAQHQATREI